MSGVKNIFGRVSYFYLWKFTRVFAIVIAALLLNPMDFGKVFFPIIIVSFFMNFFEFKIHEKDVHKFCNTMSLLAPAIGLIVSVLFFILSAFNPEMGQAYKLASAIIMFLSFKRTAETYYKNKDMSMKVYKIFFISQLIGIISALIIYRFGFGYISFLIGYLIFHILGAFMMWFKFPVKIEAKIDKGVLKDIFLTWESRLSDNLLNSIYRNGILIFVAVFMGFVEFSYLYVAFILGYFVYKNGTLFITETLLEKFQDMDQDAVKYNLIKLMEYTTLLALPLPMFLIIFSKQILHFFNMETYYILPFIAFAGMIKAIFETARLLFFIKKDNALTKIKTIEMVTLLISSLVLGKLFGIMGIAFAVLLSSIVICLLYYFVVDKIMKINIFMISRDYFFILFSGVVSGLLIGLMKEYFYGDMISLIFIIVSGMTIYVALTMAFNKNLYKLLVRFLFGMEK